MRRSTTLGALMISGALLASGCSGSRDDPGTAPGAASATVAPARAVPAACADFSPRVKDVHAHAGALVTAVATTHYRKGQRVEDTAITLARLHPATSVISATPPAPLDARALLTRVVRAWNRSQPLAHRVHTGSLMREHDSLRVHTGTTASVRSAAPYVWFRGWRTLTGTFRWSTCAGDGTTVWGQGTFTALDITSSGGAQCGAGGDIDGVARAALALECP